MASPRGHPEETVSLLVSEEGERRKKAKTGSGLCGSRRELSRAVPCPGFPGGPPPLPYTQRGALPAPRRARPPGTVHPAVDVFTVPAARSLGLVPPLGSVSLSLNAEQFAQTKIFKIEEDILNIRSKCKQRSELE